MEIALFGAMCGIASAVASLFVPGISLIESGLIYIIVSIAAVALQAILSSLPQTQPMNRR